MNVLIGQILIIFEWNTESSIHIAKFCPNGYSLGISLYSKYSNLYHSKISAYLVQPLITDYYNLSYVDLQSSIVPL